MKENSKSQSPNSRKAPISKRQRPRFLLLEFLNFSLFWNLKGGIWVFGEL